MTWTVPLTRTCLDHPGAFACAILCCHATSYRLRMRVIHGDTERYECCQGYGPRCCTRWERRCPRSCLVAETLFCFAASVMATRWLIMEKYGIRNGTPENAMVDGATAMTYATLPSAFLDSGFCTAMRWVSDSLWCCVCACAQVQHAVELDAREPPLPASSSASSSASTSAPVHKKIYRS